jgi:glycosyltransferase involved in cell wall biosynthesis
MKLWVITSSYPTKPQQSINAGVLARDLALLLLNAAHEVTLITPAKSARIEFDPGLRGVVLPAARPVDELANLSPRRPADIWTMATLFLGARSRLRRELRRSRPDGLIALWALPSGIFARWVHRWCGAPYAVWLLGSDVWKADRYPGGRRFLRRVVRDASGRFADGTALAEQARIMTGCAIDFLPSIRRLPPPAGEALSCDVLFVGRYHPNKGPDLLLEAFSTVVASRPGTTLRMHGIGELRPQLERRVAALGLAASVTVEGPIDAPALAAALRATRVLAIPSRIESIPLILGDAAQAGARVVATETGDVGRLVREHGLGQIAPAGDVPALASALLRELDRPRDPRAGPQGASFDPEIQARRLVASLGIEAQ